MTAAGTMTVDAEPNGGIEVGADRATMSRSSESNGPGRDAGAGAADCGRGEGHGAPHNVSADGPSGLGRREGWSVSYRLAVPDGFVAGAASTTNGGISIRDVDGQIEFKTVNGGVKLVNLAGDVKGRTSNGGVDVDLDGTELERRRA